MASVYTVKPGGGGDYTTLQAAIAAEVKNYDFVSNTDQITIKVYDHSTDDTTEITLTDFGTCKMSATYYLDIVGVDSGGVENPKSVWDDDAYILSCASSAQGASITPCGSTNDIYVHLRNLQIEQTTAGNVFCVGFYSANNSNHIDVCVDKCLIKYNPVGTNGIPRMTITYDTSDSGTVDIKFVNCLFHNDVLVGQNGYCSFAIYDPIDFYYCTFVDKGGDASFDAFRESSGGANNIENCCIWLDSGSSEIYYGTGTGTHDAISCNNSDTGRDITLDGDPDNEFTDYDNDDFTIISGSANVEEANVLSSGDTEPAPEDEDIEGNSRDGTSPDIGFSEYTVAGSDHELTATNTSCSVTNASATLTQEHDLTSTNIASSTTAGTSTLTQKHDLNSTLIKCDTTNAAATLSEIEQLDADDIACSVTAGTSTLTQKHDLTSDNIACSTTNAAASLTEHGTTHELTATNTSCSVTNAAASLTEYGTTHELTATSIASSVTNAAATLTEYADIIALELPAIAYGRAIDATLFIPDTLIVYEASAIAYSRAMEASALMDGKMWAWPELVSFIGLANNEAAALEWMKKTICIRGTLITGSNAGNIQLQWAKMFAGSGIAILHDGSWMKIRKLSGS